MFSIFALKFKVSTPLFGAMSSTIGQIVRTISICSNTTRSQIQVSTCTSPTLSLNYYRIGLKIPATAEEGICYENNIGNSLKCLFPGTVLNETQIANMLGGFMGKSNISNLRGIDFSICDVVHRRIYLLQVKIGARTRTVIDIGTFLSTVKIFQKYVVYSEFSKYQVIPIWYSSAELKYNAQQILKSSGVQVFIESEWNINPDKCRLFINFTNALRTGKILIE
jgi:hypothetical protein